MVYQFYVSNIFILLMTFQLLTANEHKISM